MNRTTLGLPRGASDGPKLAIAALKAVPMRADIAVPESFATGKGEAEEKAPSHDKKSAPAKSPFWSSPRPGASVLRVSPLELRVLTGVQKGARAAIRHRRLLVGNLEAECDVVLDVGSQQRHACLIRVSEDGWTALCIAGDLWLGETWIAPQNAQALTQGGVVSMGDVSFCIEDRDVDWNLARLPTRRQASLAPTPGGLASRRPSEPAAGTLGLLSKIRHLTDRGMKRVESGRDRSADGSLPAAAGTGVVVVSAIAAAMTLAGSVFFLENQSIPTTTPAVRADRPIETARAVLAAFPWARELKAQAAMRERNVVIEGFVPEREQAILLQKAFRDRGVAFESRWAVVDELAQDLRRRLSMPNAVDEIIVRYVGQGAFAIDSPVQRIDFDRSIRRAFQEVPPLRSIELRLTTSLSAARSEVTGRGTPMVVRYTRTGTGTGTGGITVTGLDQLTQPRVLQRDEVRDVRIGRLSSVVLGNGARYFEGSTLPDGSVLLQIEPTSMLVRIGVETRRIDWSDNQSSGGKRAAGTLESAPVFSGTEGAQLKVYSSPTSP